MFTTREARLIHELAARAAERWPDSVAIVDPGGSWTYAELNAKIMDYAAQIIGAGVRPGDRVVIRAVPERWVLATIYACARIGAIAVPISPDLRPAEQEQIYSDAEPALVLNGPVPGSSASVALPPSESLDPDSPVLILYTSGSTAAPKGVVCAHRSMLFAIAAIMDCLRYRSNDVVLCRVPLSFDYGLYQSYLTALCGAALVLSGPGNDSGLLATIRRYGVSVVPVVPTLAALLVRLAARGTAQTVRLFTNTGEELDSAQVGALRQAFPSAAIQLMYGTTECKRITIAHPDSDLVRPGSVGAPLPGTSVRIVDVHDRPVPPGTEGQILVSGPHLMTGYWRDPELTSRTYRRDTLTGEHWLYTGDFGHIDDGQLHLYGRRDHLFKHRGVRTSVAEVEGAARLVPGVSAAALLPPGARADAVLCVVTDLAPAEVLLRLRDRLEPLKVPTSCRVLAQLPLGPNGKVDRPALARLIDDEGGQVSYA
ncbi:class I adenylate-forming enzyme family protein [Nocardia carnea]|uniref:class I adenylate-forming enzyme family protein n=1 Tax=Nocardia carnea TaxID=37328 RepID=UPI00245684FE|nr:class I adenylate-forming enzyme family protein [Nocardia carnea]